MKIRFTNQAMKQFQAAIAYIKKDNPEAVHRLRQRAEKILRRLQEFPESGRPIPEFPELSYKEILVPPYLFFYRMKGEIIWITAVWHGAQLPREP